MPVLMTPFLFTPNVVRREVAAGHPGIYLLGHDEGGFVASYVGRSDHCVRSRLAAHELLGMFDYFAVRPARGVSDAFWMECELWHYFGQSGQHLTNAVHPGSPRGSGQRCPYCFFAEHVQPLLRAA